MKWIILITNNTWGLRFYFYNIDRLKSCLEYL